MPIYEYQCEDCAHEIEVLQKISDPVLSECPACGKLTLVKRISAPSFRLKGGGWYETDFKTGNKKNLAGDGGEKKSDAGTGKKDSAGGDKPAGKGAGADAKKSGASTGAGAD